jgi:UDP-GlcNAc:undecaprenyl-phosphate GlcNAc-1-phosphate transferase
MVHVKVSKFDAGTRSQPDCGESAGKARYNSLDPPESMPLAFYLAVPFAASLALTPVCRLLSYRLGYVAKPKEDRWHGRPTALFGGMAIAAVTIGAGFTIPALGPLRTLIGCGALIALFGFVDDVLPLKPSTKLIVQITVASTLLFFGFRLQWTQSMLGDAMLTLFWIVGMTNAFNLLDNMDGLCAGTAIIAGAFLLIGVVDAGGVTPTALYLAALIGATAGFFVYNTHPASIFMGDTGSLFLGLNLAAMALVDKPRTHSASGLLPVVAAPVLPLLLPIFDTTLVTALRVLSRRRPSQGGRDHTSHRLVAVGLSEPRAVVTLWALAAAGGVISLLVQRHDPALGVIAALIFCIAMAIFAVYLARVRVYEDADLALLKGESFTPLVANFMYKRRVAEVLLDLVLIPTAYYIAYRLRFEGAQFGLNYHTFLESMPVVLASQLIALFIVGGYRGTWRHFGMMDAVVFGKGVVLGTAVAELFILYVYRFESYSRSVFVIDAALLLLLLAGTRASFRLVGEYVARQSTIGQRCIIYGTSGASLATIREAFAPAALKILGFIDDDPLHRHSRVGGYSVVGSYADLLALVRAGGLDCVVLNTPLLDVDRLQALERCCEERDVQILRLQMQLTRVSTAS